MTEQSSDNTPFDSTTSDSTDKASPPVESTPPVPRDRPTPEGDGLDPTRYGDWEKNGRCIDF